MVFRMIISVANNVLCAQSHQIILQRVTSGVFIDFYLTEVFTLLCPEHSNEHLYTGRFLHL